MRTIILALVFLCGMVSAQTDKTAVETAMKAQEAAWNAGDIPKFMDWYWKSDSLKFIGSKGITYGWQATLDNYLKSYNSPDKMGKLTFTLLSVEQLSSDCMFVIGSWQLAREKPIGGHFSLLWKKIGGRWVIVSDHTS